MTELGLGTAQLGLPYGISNRGGQPAETTAGAIVQRAVRGGVRTFDTAPAYGGSEALVGRLLRNGNEVRVVTKTPPLAAAEVTEADCEALRRSAERSCERLGRTRLDALLVHHGSDLGLPGGERLAATVVGMRDDGILARIGVSVYDREELDTARRLLPLDIVQLPLNVFDQRFLRDGTLAELGKEGVEVHARSAFLQGLLLMEPEELPERVSAAAELLHRWHGTRRQAGLTAIEATLAFARSTGVDVVLVGTNSVAELEECIAAMATEASPQLDSASLAADDPELIDPRRWTP